MPTYSTLPRLSRVVLFLGLAAWFAGCDCNGGNSAPIPQDGGGVDGGALSGRDGSGSDPDGSLDGSTEPCIWNEFNDGIMGGRVDDVRFDPRDPNTIYAAASRRFYRSRDRGTTWELRGEAPERLVQLAFPVAQSVDTVLAASGNGLLVTQDGGATWGTLALQGVSIQALLTHPAESRRLFVALQGSGILRSSDGGETWRPANQGVPFSSISRLTGDPRDPDVVLASAELLNVSGGPLREVAVLRSDNGGLNWVTVASGRGQSRWIDVCASDPDFVVAGIGSGVATSTDGGQTFSPASPLPFNNVPTVAIGGSGCQTLYATVWQSGVHRSADLGGSWDGPFVSGMADRIREPYPRTFSLAPDDGAEVLAATHAGAFHTSNGGSQWMVVANVGTLTTRRMAVSPADPARVWLATWGSGLWTRPSLDQPWQQVDPAVLPSDFTFTIEPDPRSIDRIVAGSSSSIVLSVDAAGSFAEVGAGNLFDVAYHPADDGLLLAGTQLRGILASEDGGANWNDSNGGLSAWMTPQGRFIDIRHVLYAPDDPRIAIAGSNGRGLFRSGDSGRNWSPTAPGFDSSSIACLVAVNVGPARGIYACSLSLGLLRSSDNGVSWEDASDGLTSLSTNGLAVDSVTGMLYLSTADGMFFSQTGHAWERFGADCLPGGAATLPVVVHGNDGTRWLAASSGADGAFTVPL